MAGTSAQGTGFSFSGTSYSITSFSITDTQDLIDGSHLGIAAGGAREYVGGFATDVEVSVDFIGSNAPSAGASGQLQFSGTFSGVSGNATCSTSTVTGSVGSLISGSATFRLA